MDFLVDYYLELKVLHILSFVSWFAALFYLPRLFVYHSANLQTKAYTDIVEVQEAKLYKYIAMPAMIGTILSGFLLLMGNLSIMSGAGFMHAKLMLVLLLIGFHFSLGYYKNALTNKTCKRSGKFFRFYNEIPTLLLVGIVVLVVLRPF
ncbi:MAG: Protoporphyrinogen IX oxidase, novel form, HemJ (EC [uncultured Campylobacterales bacterium]|uniref:Protoporphyrinogen IX oxidase n=1 Tax=uncultured Campylobacterales bacterium TaxID=352960 RepID=A0A6S6S6U5_9BACT|nr:MAG: Protoporphyrinogen IX oxidase, novel form, HemJ (EC [uncultured Campylobacterales bacterium]